jgi:glycosyltransferase involved in cell wall biosynthesis
MARWFDISDLVHWIGQPTGIQRVVYELGRRFARDGQTRFFTHTSPGVFEEVPFTHPFARTLDSSAARPAVPSAKALLRAIIPGPVRRLRASLHDYRRAHATQSVSQKTTICRHPFGPADTVMLTGSSWSHDFLAHFSTIKPRAGLQVASVLYDLIPLTFPHFFVAGFAEQYETWARRHFDTADCLLCISSNTRADAEDFERVNRLPQKPKRVFRLGDEVRDGPPASPRPVSLIAAGTYVLNVGTVEVRKNHVVLYRAWLHALAHGLDMPHLVIVGRIGWLAQDIAYQMRNDPRVKERIHILTDVDDAQLDWLYRHCAFTVYPSFYEGWGLPIAESLAAGKLCVASATSSMPEVGGELAAYADPLSAEDYARTISDLWTNPERRVAMEGRIRAEYRSVSWDSTYKQVVAAVDELTIGGGER